MSELAEFLEGEEPTVEAPTEPEAVKEPPAEPEPETPKEPEATAEEPQGSTTEPEEPEKTGHVPLAALLDEREKRQNLQRELEQLQARQTETPPAQRPDPIDDPEAYASHVQEMVNASKFETKTEVSQAMMRMQHDDYDAMETAFVEMAKASPELWQKLREAPLPAQFAYTTAKNAERLAAMENVDEWEAKKEAEIEARVLAKMEAKAAEKAKQDAKGDALSPSLTTQRAEGANAPVMDVPDPLKSTFNR